MANAIEMTRSVSKTWNTNARDERSETDPSHSLTMREVEDLRRRFRFVESELGIRSTEGAIEDRLNRETPSDEAIWVDRQERRIRTCLQKGRLPPLPSARKGLSDRYQLAAGCIRVDLGDLSDEYMHQHTAVNWTAKDPYENDSVLWLVQMMRDVDRRRMIVGRSHDRILQAVYGDSTLGSDAIVFRKRFGDLMDVVVAIVNSQRKDGDPPARAMVRAKLGDDRFVRIMNHGAGEYLRKACDAYAVTR